MGTTLFTSCSFPFKYHLQSSQSLCSNSQQSEQINKFHMHMRPALENTEGRVEISAEAKENGFMDDEFEKKFGLLRRRAAIMSGLSLVSGALGFAGDGLAAVKQGLLAGRIPGLSEPDEKGWKTYRRPDDKSGGHGVGWSPIIPYIFKVPDGWEEVPVSIADLGGTEIDLRFANSQEGRLFVIVAPVLRFADLGEDAKIEEIGPPEKVINAFGPEVIGENVEGKVLSMEVAEHSGRTYYQFELEPPHALITATAAGNRLYLFNITGNGLQWKRHYKDLKQIADSFRVV
ncbi:psbP domain-containing protein 4, chloroplastic isoform X2 [Cinnamomum micranthum f. kanehirae]|uniref:PsbP domain-containing protein 4, chloroplastic isoform X2 n=1 Tax=Cinnamomum micranthum f. kanehirae TaxID=337451 RepID=A0A3S3QYV1_9MAGN|nr:psbP domain-containing protein 4, chloroplastic isoform X2 [Cinnamomum micranthum f. kanehirae]